MILAAAVFPPLAALFAGCAIALFFAAGLDLFFNERVPLSEDPFDWADGLIWAITLGCGGWAMYLFHLFGQAVWQLL